MQFILGHSKHFCLDFTKVTLFIYKFEGKIMLRVLTALSLLLVYPTSSVSAAINEAGAKQLKASFQELLDYQKAVNEGLGSVTMNYEGALSVVPNTEFYTVTFPRITLSSPELTNEAGEVIKLDDSVFDIGVITLNAMPDEKPNYWKIVMTLPQTMTMSEDGKPDEDFTVSFADHNAIAMYNDALGYFTKMNINLNGLTFQIGGEDVGVKADALQLYTNFDEKEDTRFTGPAYLSVNNLHISPEDQSETVNIGELKVEVTMTDFVLPTLKEYQEKLLKHADTFQALQTINPDETSSVATPEDFMNMFTDFYDFDLSGASIKYGVKDVLVSSDPEDELAEFDTLSLGDAHFGMGVEGMKSETGQLSFDVAYNDFKMTPETEEYKDMLPTQSGFSLKADKVPFTTLMAIGKNTAQSVMESPNSAQFAAIGLMARLPAVFMKAETELLLSDTGVSNDTYDVSMNGAVKTDVTSMMGFAANMKAVFEGLDTVLSLAKTRAADEENNMSFEYGEIAAQLEKLKSAGVATTGPNGKAAYGYDFASTPQGQFTVNGQDINVLFEDEPMDAPVVE